MNRDWLNFSETLAKELGSDIAEHFVKDLYVVSRGDVSRAEHFFYHLGQAWAPLIHSWSEWVEKNAKHKSIALVLRDAKPLEVLPISKDWKKIYINRTICGIPDEISNDMVVTMDPMLEEYLKENDCYDEFTFVDSGCYGSIVLELHKTLGMKFQPLFFFSKNPNIPGFLNSIGISEYEGTIINDSLECTFPNVFKRPKEIFRPRLNGQKPKILLEKTDELSNLFGSAALRGVREFEYVNNLSAKQAAEQILFLSQKAKEGSFTGILATETSQWTGKDEFLRNWPEELRCT